MRLGPTWRVALSDNVALSLGGGLALAIADSEFSFAETVVLAGGGSATRSGSDRQVDFLAGGYAAARISVSLSRSWSAVARAQYQNIGSYSHRAGAKIATVNLGESIFATGGISFAF